MRGGSRLTAELLSTPAPGERYGEMCVCTYVSVRAKRSVCAAERSRFVPNVVRRNEPI